MIFLRSIQSVGFLAAVAAIVLTNMALSPITPDTPSAQAGSAGLLLLFIVVPLFGVSALLVIPSSLALFKTRVRVANRFSGKFWYSVWLINLVLSAGYFALAIYIAVSV